MAIVSVFGMPANDALFGLARFDESFRNPEHLYIAIVDQGILHVLVEHVDTVRHLRQREFQLGGGIIEFRGARSDVFFQYRLLPLDFIQRPNHRGAQCLEVPC